MPKAYRYLFVVLLGMAALDLKGQQTAPPPAAPASLAPGDTAHARNVYEAFRRGTWRGRARDYFMNTINRGDLTDYYANGLLVGARFETAPLHGFQVGVGGSFLANTRSSNLLAPGYPAAGAPSSRYEIGLFDLENPTRREMGRAEELYLRYRFHQSTATFGRQLLNTPLINPQDGRLTPTFEQGLWVEVNEVKNTTITVGWLTHMAPRSTTRWYPIGSSIGFYPMGVTVEGTRAAYAGHLSSRGIGVLALSRQIGKQTKLQVWNYYVDRLFNTLFAEASTTLPVPGTADKVTVGAQYLHQNTLADGGNADSRFTLLSKGARADIFSTRLGYQRGRVSMSANYTRITRVGRFLFPREWGREPFYTFLPRERNEGFGDVHAFVGLLAYAPRPNAWRLEAGYGQCYVPSVLNTRLNKYGFPSYRQVNFSAVYPFTGGLKGLRVQALYVYKGALGNTYGQARYRLNKVDMHLLNLIVNYDF